MSTITKEWLQKTIAELEEELDATPGAVNEDAAKALAAMKLALASLEAEAVAYMIGGHYLMHTQDPKVDNYTSAVPLYTAPPAPVSVPDAIHSQGEKSASDDYYALGWNACRTAMLQGVAGNSPVIPDGYVLVPVDPTEEMIAAAMCSNDVLFDKEDDTLFRVQHGEIWRAMLSTAPQQEVKP